MNEENENEFSISIKDIFLVLLNRIWLIILAGFLGGVIGFSYSYFGIKREYDASIKVYINSSSISSTLESITTGTINASRDLVDTYEQIIKAKDQVKLFLSTTTLEEEYEIDDVCDMISVKSLGGTEVCKIVVRCTNEHDAAQIAESISFHLSDIMTEIIKGSSVSIVEGREEIVVEEVSKGTVKKAIIGALIAAVLVAGVFILVDIFIDDRIKSSETLTNMFGQKIPTLAIIPESGTTGGKKNSHYYKSRYYKEEYYNNDVNGDK